MAKNVLLSIVIILFTSPFVFGQYNPLLSQHTSPFNLYTETDFCVSESFQPKSERKAMLLTATVPAATILIGSLLLGNETTLGGFLIVEGIIIGPSAGNMYAEHTKTVLKGIGARIAGGGMLVIGSYFTILDEFAKPAGENGSDGLAVAGAVLFFSGTGVIIYSFVHDLFKSAENVRKYNQKNQGKDFAISPVYFPKEKAAGISLSVRF